MWQYKNVLVNPSKDSHFMAGDIELVMNWYSIVIQICCNCKKFKSKAHAAKLKTTVDVCLLCYIITTTQPCPGPNHTINTHIFCLLK